MKKMTRTRIIAALALLFGALPANATTSLFVTPNGLRVAPKTYNGTLYGPTGPAAPNWHVTQWVSPASDLPVFSALTNGAWRTFNWAAQIIWGSTGGPPNQIKMSSIVSGFGSPGPGGGQLIPCNTEFDVFYEPNTPVYPGYPTGIVSTPLISSLSSLIYNVTLRNISISSSAPACSTQQVLQFASIILNNTTTSQVLYYQIVLAGTITTPS